MLRQWRWIGLCLVAFGLAVGMNPTSDAGGKKGKGQKAEMTPIDIMVMAAKMEEFAKQTKSPSALLAAGELYWTIVPKSIEEKKDIEVKTENEKGEKGDPAPELPKAEDPRDKANELFKLAQEYAKPGEKSGVEELIKGIKGTLGSNKGPHSINKTIGGHQNQHIRVNFKGKQVAQLGFRCHHNVPLRITISGPGANASDYSIYGNMAWLPPTNGTVTIHVHNPHQKGVAYTFWVN